ncbi:MULTISPECIES: TIGR04255 family protein [Proteus]|uniref:TIGR04255 family protein n=1 Tax=Proteus TaxID=583 RepID=UPI0013787438|nr:MULTISPECIES: TIGR04255 family protein [Proteus]MBG5950859.1 TIGR04255 family protein [Proteus terrae]MCE9838112.1 TIGR04255 family protein [Proteus terrae]NBN69701.1 TIGR04255 family protein [Proteus sp. G2618]
MVNKIVAKKISIRFEKLGISGFKSKLETLQEVLRDRFPKSFMPRVQAFNIDITNPNTVQIDQDGVYELYMASADGLHSLKIGNQGFDYTVHRYASFDVQKEFFLHVVKNVIDVMEVKYIGYLSVQNINLFTCDTDGATPHIRKNSPLATTDIGIDKSWKQAGVATRHDYEMDDGSIGLVVLSTIAQVGQSFVPQTEWELWQFVGGIPVIQNISLLVTISVVHHQGRKAQRSPGGNLVELDLNKVESQLEQLHQHLNQTYSSLIIIGD